MLATFAFLVFGAANPDNTALPTKLDLPTAMRIFHDRGYDLLIADANVESARGQMQAAGALQNPQLGGSWGRSFDYNCDAKDPNTHCSGTTQWTASFVEPQALSDLIFGKRRLRVNVGRAALEAAKMDRKDAQRNLEFVLKQQFLATVLADQTLSFALEAQGTFDHTADLFSIKYKAGAVSEADLARVETAALESQQQVDSAHANAAQARAQLAYLLGVRGETPDFSLEDDWVDSNASPELSNAGVALLLDTARRNRPDLLSAAKQKERAEFNLSLSKRLRVPDLAWNVNYVGEGTGVTAIQPPTLSVGITLTLPLWYQYQGEITQAVADISTQKALYDKTDGQVVSDVEQAYAAFTYSRNQVDRMRNRLRERSARAKELVQIQYEKGAASLIDLLDAQRTYITVNLEYFENLSDYWTAVFQLQQAIAAENPS